MNKIAKASWLRRMLDSAWWFVLRQTRVKSGPLMFEVRGEWFYLDFNGDLFRLRPTDGYDQSPLMITLERRA